MHRIIFSALAVTLLAGIAHSAEPTPTPVPALPIAVPTAAPNSPATTPAPADAKPSNDYTEPLLAPKPQPVIANLNDGSKIEFDADGTVWVLQENATRTPAPDGTLTLKDGTPFIVRDGHRVSSE